MWPRAATTPALKPAARNPKIGVILPDSSSSSRWETADRKYLEAAFEAAGVDYDIRNAQDDKAQFQTLADQMITEGVNVLMIVNLDSGTGKAVLDKAKSQGVATIDYDRLTLGGSAEYYVSFDNEAVGRLQGEGLVKCLTDKGVKNPVVAYLNGSPTDNNATLFKNGYDSVLKPKFDSKEYVKGPEQSVPDWDGGQATTIFEQMLTQTGGKIDGVLAANDTPRQRRHRRAEEEQAQRQGARHRTGRHRPGPAEHPRRRPVHDGLQGDQAGGRSSRRAGDRAGQGREEGPPQTVRDPEGNRDVPAVLLTPKAIFKENVKDVIDDGYVTKEEVCTSEFAKVCAEAGIS